MKIYVSTFFDNGNLGSELQALAMNEFLHSNGFDEVIFIKKYFSNKFLKIINYLRIRACEFFLDKDLKHLLKVKNGYSRHHEKVSEQTLKLISEFSKKSLLSLKIPIITRKMKKDGLFICGSDQIWSPLIFFNNDFYFLKNIKSNKKIAYAPSFGVTTSLEKHIIKRKSQIREFQFLSFREKSSSQLVNDLLDCHSIVVCDPVFLMGKPWWKDKANQQTPLFDDYIFLYFLDKPTNEVLTQIKKSFSSLTKIYICYKKFFSIDESFIFIDAGPDIFINLIKNAKMIITDSFHAVAFSIIFEKDFYVYSRNQPKEIKQESRIKDLLSDLGLANRFNSFDISKTHIDYTSTNVVLKQRIDDSKAFLLGALKDIEGL